MNTWRQYLLYNGHVRCSYSLIDAVRYGHYDCAKLHLENNADANCKTIEKLIDGKFINLTSENTFLAAFDFAFRRGSVELAEKILSSDSYSQIEQLYPKAAYYSAKNNWPNILSKLLEKRVDINALTKGQTPLCAACKKGHESVVRLLLDNGADPSVPNDSGTTALHFAVGGHDDTSTVQMLLSAGANVNALDRYSVSPLFLACEKGKTEFVKLLLSRGANPNIATVHVGYPIHAASSYLHNDVVKLLLEYDADVNGRDEFGETALHAVSLNSWSTDSDKRSDLVQLLHDAGADVNAVSEEGETPLCIACSRGLESTAMKMLECGAKVDGIGGKELPLHAACRNEYVSLVQLLLSNGANPNLLEEGYRDTSPLVEACLVQNGELVDMLLEHGADPNLVSTSSDFDSEYLILFVAVDKCNNDIVTSLLNAGANVNAVNGRGESLVSFATENATSSGYMEEMRIKLSTVRLLLQHGAKVNKITPDGLSVSLLDLAVSTRHAQRWRHEYRSCVAELLQLLVTYGAELQDYCNQSGDSDNVLYLQELDVPTLTVLVRFDGEHRSIVEVFRAGAGFQLLARCCEAVTLPLEAKSISLCQAAVLAGYVPNDEELQQLQLAAAGDHSAGHLCRQLMNWLDEDRQQVPSLQRQCRVVIRRQLSVAARFKSILPAIDKLPLPNIVKLYLQFDGPLSEVDLNVLIPTHA